MTYPPRSHRNKSTSAQRLEQKGRVAASVGARQIGQRDGGSFGVLLMGSRRVSTATSRTTLLVFCLRAGRCSGIRRWPRRSQCGRCRNRVGGINIRSSRDRRPPLGFIDSARFIIPSLALEQRRVPFGATDQELALECLGVPYGPPRRRGIHGR
jgi:hypothetical protein